MQFANEDRDNWWGRLSTPSCSTRTLGPLLVNGKPKTLMKDWLYLTGPGWRAYAGHIDLQEAESKIHYSEGINGTWPELRKLDQKEWWTDVNLAPADFLGAREALLWMYMDQPDASVVTVEVNGRLEVPFVQPADPAVKSWTTCRTRYRKIPLGVLVPGVNRVRFLIRPYPACTATSPVWMSDFRVHLSGSDLK